MVYSLDHTFIFSQYSLPIHLLQSPLYSSSACRFSSGTEYTPENNWFKWKVKAILLTKNTSKFVSLQWWEEPYGMEEQVFKQMGSGWLTPSISSWWASAGVCAQEGGRLHSCWAASRNARGSLICSGEAADGPEVHRPQGQGHGHIPSMSFADAGLWCSNSPLCATLA